MQLQQYFNHYLTPMNNNNGKFGIIDVVCCFFYIHPSSQRFKSKNTVNSVDINFIYFSDSFMNFINFECEALYLSHISAPHKITYFLPNWPCMYNM